jgi:RNA polymerase sigma-70 factor (ECF subfamily)
MSFVYNQSDDQLIIRLSKDDRSAFTMIFKKYYSDLVHYAHTIITDVMQSEDIVQEVFVKLWENRTKTFVHGSLISYLLKAVHNRCVDFIRHHEVTGRYTALTLKQALNSYNNIDTYILQSEIQANYNDALDRIPDVYAMVYKMNRNESLTYAEIAEKLNLSVRTIEVRMGKALSLLREELKDFI